MEGEREGSVSPRSGLTPLEDTRGPLSLWQAEPKEKAQQGPGREGRWAEQWGRGRGTHRPVSYAPLLTALPTPSTPGQGQLAGNADLPKPELFLQ